MSTTLVKQFMYYMKKGISGLTGNRLYYLSMTRSKNCTIISLEFPCVKFQQNLYSDLDLNAWSQTDIQTWIQYKVFFFNL